MNLYSALSYIRHGLTARGTKGYGVHSPFLYRFITTIVREGHVGRKSGGVIDGDRPSLKKVTDRVEELRQEMLGESRLVEVHDMGVGSAACRRRRRWEKQVTGISAGRDVTVTSLRRVSNIASVAALPQKEISLLVKIAINLDGLLRKMIPVSEELVAADREGAAGGYSLVTEKGGETGRVADRNAGKHCGRVADRETGGETGRERDSDWSHPQVTDADSDWSHPQVTDADSDWSHPQVTDAGSDWSHPQVTDAGRENREAEVTTGERSHKVILELGTSLGISTLALALAAPGRRVVTIEGSSTLAAIARENLRRYGAENAEVICMEFSEALATLKNRNISVEMAFIDGNHRGSALKKYVESIKSLGEKMIIVADDIRMNRDMHEAWQQLSGWQTALMAAPASIETFRFGILFFLPWITPGKHLVRY